jgi:hypothetical protein
MLVMPDNGLQRIEEIIEDYIADTGRLPSTPDVIRSAGQPRKRVRDGLDSLVKEGRLVIVYKAPKNPTIFMPRYMYDVLMKEQKVPEWMAEFTLARARAIEERIRSQHDELVELRHVEGLLYSAGRSLEEAVEVSLKKLQFDGLQVTYEDPDRWDFTFEHGGRVYICDAKGKGKWADKADVGQLTLWLQKYVDENPGADPGEVEGLLIINHFRELPPSERWPHDPANTPISDAAERYLRLGRHHYLATVDLFFIARDVVEGKASPEDARQRLMSKVKTATTVD